MWAVNKNRGFTIVELLIVIVVIAVLASITVVAFNGVVKRSENTARIAAAQKMYKLMRAYITANGSAQFKSVAPAATGFCLGSNYVDMDSGSGTGCVYEGYPNDPENTPSITSSIMGLDAALKTIGNDTVTPPVLEQRYEDGYVIRTSAPTYVYDTNIGIPILVDGKPNVYGFIYYVLKGVDQDCVLRPLVQFDSYDGTNYNLTTQNTYMNTSWNTELDITECYLYLHPNAI